MPYEVSSDSFHENYAAAQLQLKSKLDRGQLLPDVILINTPYIKDALNSFVQWLQNTVGLKEIPVIYDRSILSAVDLKELRSLKQIDDIVDTDININLLKTKCYLLKCSKERKNPYNFKAQKRAAATKITIQTRTDSALRRLFNIILSLCLIIFLLPVFIIVAILIKLESDGPIIYTSLRAGQGYRVFKFLKFRTMHVNADIKRTELEKLNLYTAQETSPKFFKIKNDPRVTRLGAFLRNTSLDELPQLFNVLKGDMSIVGNRPLPLYEAHTLITNNYAERFIAPAGITGLWQIMKRGKEEMSVEERINLDINYAQKNSLLFDLWIIFKTPLALFQKTNV
ncbi:MAG TPA: sugar transferase [Segetibacter sp.]|jgi:lipopolysaccharide/colanic/teichoic acid biosynthesis glycosyltransferase